MSDLIQHLKETADVMTAAQIGSPDAIADCQRRLHAAQRNANRERFRQLRDEEPLTADDFEDSRDYETATEGDEN